MRIPAFFIITVFLLSGACHDIATNDASKPVSSQPIMQADSARNFTSYLENIRANRPISATELLGKWMMTGFNFPGTDKSLSDQINRSAGFQYWLFTVGNGFEMKMKVGTVIRGTYRYDVVNGNLLLNINGVNAVYRILGKEDKVMKVQSGSLGSVIEFERISEK